MYIQKVRNYRKLKIVLKIADNKKFRLQKRTSVIIAQMRLIPLFVLVSNGLSDYIKATYICMCIQTNALHAKVTDVC